MRATALSIQKGLEFLTNEQQSDGSFLTYSSPSYDTANHSLAFHSTFTTSLITDCLQHVPVSPLRDSILKKSVDFLRTQKSDQWTWNYWVRGSEEEKTLPYPDDLDDTCCALAALYTYDSSYINGSVLAHIVTILTQLEVKVGGPYKTWIVPDDSDDIWKDIDLAVNANIGYFLSLYDVSLPSIQEFIEKSIKKSSLTSPYYASFFPVLYFIARWYKGNHQAKLVKQLITHQLGECWGTDIQTALALSSLLSLHYDAKKINNSIDFLQTNQKKDGSWEWGAFYTGVNPKKDKTYYAGSPALTTAFCMQAISQYQHLITKTSQTTSHSSTSTYHTAVLSRVNQRLLAWSPQGYKTIEPLLDKLTQGKTGEQLVLLPYVFWESLDPTLKTKVKNPSELLILLSCATIYGWIAYTVYDNILDNEGNPEELSVANLCLRELTYIFTHAITLVDTPDSIHKQIAFNNLFTRVMDSLDNANQWEVTNAHISPSITLNAITVPVYKELSISPTLTHSRNKKTPSIPPLSARSLGHALAPLCLLVSVGIDINSKTMKSIERFFHCYLTARQMNDDAHDWEEDLRHGRINCVGSYILQHMHTSKKYSKKNLLELVKSQELHTLFWDKLIPDISRKVLEVCDEGEAIIIKTPQIIHKDLFLSMMKGQRKIANDALSQQKEVHQFLNSIT